jgi:hypothetical protein
MAEEDLRALLNEVGGWDGFEVQAIRREDTLEPGVLGDPSPRLVIELRAVPLGPHARAPNARACTSHLPLTWSVSPKGTGVRGSRRFARRAAVPRPWLLPRP